MKKIVITGGLGYIGMELAKIYSGKTTHYDVLVLDNVFYSERVSQLKRWGIKFQQIDITEKNNLQTAICDADIIYHLAGITDVGTTTKDKNLQRDRLIKKVGVDGTKNIIDLSTKETKIVFPSTHVIFEGLKSVEKSISENRQPLPVLEYSKGKVKSEIDLIQSNKNYVILRLGSVYGKSYDSTRLNIMPNLFSKNSSYDGEIKLFSNGDANGDANTDILVNCKYNDKFKKYEPISKAETDKISDFSVISAK